MKNHIKKITAKISLWNTIRIACFMFLFTLMTPSAHAYVDPATTAMLTQIVAGIVISLGVAFGVFRRKIVMFFKNLSVKRTRMKIEKQNRKQGDDK